MISYQMILCTVRVYTANQLLIERLREILVFDNKFSQQFSKYCVII